MHGRRASLLLLFSLLFGANLWAQGTGGRFGGSRGFSGGGSRSSFGSSPSRSYGGSSYSTPSTPRMPAFPSATSSSTRMSTGNYRTPYAPRLITVLEYQRPDAGPGTIRRPVTDVAAPVTIEETRFFTQPVFDSAHDPSTFAPALGVGSVLTLFGFVVTFMLGASVPSRAKPVLSSDVPLKLSCEVRRISIGFDWRQRARLQGALASAAANEDTQTASGLAAAARLTLSLLEDALPTARYAMFQSSRVTRDFADAAFARVVAGLSSRSRKLVIDGKKRSAPVEPLVAGVEEGAGFVVVSVVVGTSAFLRALPDKLDRTTLAKALSVMMPSNEDDLVALEVTWTPAAEMDRLSSAELEVVHADLLPLEGGSDVGRVRCTYCRAIHAAELAECPACGANESKRSVEKPTATGLTDIACAHCGQPTPGFEVRCRHCGARAAK